MEEQRLSGSENIKMSLKEHLFLEITDYEENDNWSLCVFLEPLRPGEHRGWAFVEILWFGFERKKEKRYYE